jgi:hypothetical protein
MTAYVWVIALHTAVAVLGTGLLGAIAIVARIARKSAVERPTFAVIGTLASITSWSLVLLLLTGALAMYFGTTVFLGMWWMRISIVLFVALGALIGQVRLAARRGNPASLGRIEWLAWTMCALLFAIVVLMEGKPF